MKLIVVVIRGANTRFLPAYGNSWIQLPNLSVLSARGLTLDYYFASSWNEKDIRQAWLGDSWFGDKKPEKDLSEILSNAGWNLAFLSDHQNECPTEFQKAFTFQNFIAGASENPLLLHSAMEKNEAYLSEKNALIWIETDFLLPPWKVSEEFLSPFVEELHDYLLDKEEVEEGAEMPVPILNPKEERLESNDLNFLARQSGLAAAWFQMDDFVGAIVASAQEKFKEGEFAILVTSDHGLAIGEHGGFCDNPNLLYNEWVHLPMVIYAPSRGIAGQRFQGFWQDLDLAPTILDLAGLPHDGFHGKSILQGNGIHSGSRPYSICRAEGKSGEKLYALRTENHTYLENRAEKEEARQELYLMPEDILEINEVSKSNHGFVEEYEKIAATLTKGETPQALQLLENLIQQGH
jgi:hypothetical protein